MTMDEGINPHDCGQWITFSEVSNQMHLHLHTDLTPLQLHLAKAYF